MKKLTGVKAAALGMALMANGFANAEELRMQIIDVDHQVVLERTEWTVMGENGKQYHRVAAGSSHRFEVPKGRYVITATTASGLTGSAQFVVRADRRGVLMVSNFYGVKP